MTDSIAKTADGMPRWALRVVAGLSVSALATVGSFLLVGAIGDIRQHGNRIETLEARNQAQEKRLDRIEDKLDEVLRRLPK